MIFYMEEDLEMFERERKRKSVLSAWCREEGVPGSRVHPQMASAWEVLGNFANISMLKSQFGVN